jgi:uncharacterized protein YqgV (UPF0045/DUF77 family)
MCKGLKYINMAGLKKAVTRGIVVCCLAGTLATTFAVVQDAQPVFAAASAVTTVRQDRRPDRERPVSTSQASSNSGFSQHSSSTSSGSHSRPRVVRH